MPFCQRSVRCIYFKQCFRVFRSYSYECGFTILILHWVFFNLGLLH